MTDALSARPGLSWSIDAANSTPGCTITGATMTCAFGDLASGNSVTVHITSPTQVAGRVKNFATCSTAYSYKTWRSAAMIKVS